MSIKVLLADDTDIMRRAIRRLLEDQPGLELVGEAVDFDQTIRMTNDLKPQVIVMDLHMPIANTNKATPLDIRSHLNLGTSRLVAISFANDENTKVLAESFGAATLLDKMNLCNELIPTIMQLVSPNAGMPA